MNIKYDVIDPTGANRLWVESLGLTTGGYWVNRIDYSVEDPQPHHSMLAYRIAKKVVNFLNIKNVWSKFN